MTLKKINQDELENKIGVSRQPISSIEKNRYVPSTVLVLRLFRLFDKPVNDFFELEDIETPIPNTMSN